MNWRIHYDVTNHKQLNTDFFEACQYGYLSIVNSLIDHPLLDWSNRADLPNNAFMYACANGHVAVVDRLLKDTRIDPTLDKNEALGESCANGRFAIVERLLQDSRVEPYYTCIGFAAQTGDVQMVKRLLKDPRVTPEADGNWGLMEAMDQKQFAIVALLLENPVILFYPCQYRYGVLKEDYIDVTHENAEMKTHRELLDLIAIKRRQWHIRRKRRFQRLHNELVAVCGRKQK